MSAPTPAPRLRIVYRSHGGDNGKGRPPYYSKLLALTSMLRAAEELDTSPDITFVNDGPIPQHIRSLMAANGEIVPIVGGSNRSSFRTAVSQEKARTGDPEDIIWFAEDDYLYRPDAFRHLLTAAGELPHADYFALYGTESLDIDSSRRFPRIRPKLGAASDPHAVTLEDVQWFRGVSTTSSFGVRRGALRQDARLLRICPFTGGSWDTTTCLLLQGYVPFDRAALADDLWPAGVPLGERLKRFARGIVRTAISTRALRRPSRRRALMSSDPLLITHMDLTCGPPDHPASCTDPDADWPGVAADTAAWAAERGIPISPRPDEVSPSSSRH